MATAKVRACVVTFVAALVTGCAQHAASLPLVSRVAVTGAATVESAGGLSEIPRNPGQFTPNRCPPQAVFIRLDTEIRGYPLDASGSTWPCRRIAGSKTGLLEGGPMAVSVHGDVHSLSFQAEYGLTIQRGDANGNIAPLRAVNVDQDHVALAVDSHINDYVVASENYTADNCWYVVLDRQTQPARENCDMNVIAIRALTMDNRDELLVIGNETGTGRGRIDVYADPAGPAPRLVRSIHGATTGLASLSPLLVYFDVSYSLATDPRSGELYVYDHVYDGLGGRLPGLSAAKISEFSATANGDVAPRRIVSGPKANLVAQAFAANVLAVDESGRLYVMSPGPAPVVSVFGPAAHGNAAPDRTFSDQTVTVGFFGASLAVRSAAK